MVFLTFIFIPIIVALGFLLFGGRRITLVEFFGHLAVQAIIAGISMAVVFSSNTTDIEVFNGTVSSKESDRVHCRHSYSCNCYQSCSGSGNNRSCHRVCSTCYEHAYDVDWLVHSGVGTFNIAKVDRRGLEKPARWEQVQVGEPVSRTGSYTNYIKGAPDTLFRHQGLVEKYKSSIPDYPTEIYDYYHLNRLVTVGFSVPDSVDWNSSIKSLNGRIGPKKEANIVVVLIKDKPAEYFYALRQAWIGGKKNDVVIVASVASDETTIQWADVMAWTDNELFKVQLRDEILSHKSLSRDLIISSIEKHVSSSYLRKSMKDFEYLEASIMPSTTQYIISIALGTIASVLFGFWLLKNEIVADEGENARGRKTHLKQRRF